MHASLTPTVDQDFLVAVPHTEPGVTLTYYDSSGGTMTLADPRAWVYDGRRDERHSCVLYGGTLPVTASGNEITDATRYTATSGDGRAYADSSVGIWTGTTNLVPNGSFETNASGWSATNGATLTQDTAQAIFGTHALKVVTTSGAGDGATTTTGGSGMAASAGTVYTASVWQYGTAALTLGIAWYNGASLLSTSTLNFTGSGAWARRVLTATAPASTTNASLQVTVQSGGVVTYWLDGAQFEAQGLATHVVATNGSSASRGNGRLQLGSGVLTGSQGWFATLVRPGYPSTSLPTTTVSLQDWTASSTSYVRLTLGTGGTATVAWAGTGGTVTAHAPASWSAEATVLVAGQWGPNGAQVAVNSVAFTTTAGTVNPSALPGSFDLGSNGSGQWLDGEILWCAAGTGGLLPGDLAYLLGLGATDPSPVAFSGAAAASMVWAASRVGSAQGTAEAGQADISGLFRLGFGNNLIVVVPEAQGGVANITDLRFSVQLQVTPRYYYLNGADT